MAQVSTRVVLLKSFFWHSNSGEDGSPAFHQYFKPNISYLWCHLAEYYDHVSLSCHGMWTEAPKTRPQIDALTPTNKISHPPKSRSLTRPLFFVSFPFTWQASLWLKQKYLKALRHRRGTSKPACLNTRTQRAPFTKAKRARNRPESTSSHHLMSRMPMLFTATQRLSYLQKQKRFVFTGRTSLYCFLTCSSVLSGEKSITECYL